MFSRIADFFRFWWGALYWNIRKSVFRLRPRSACPCQNPSDSGKAMQTGCEAAQNWNHPAAFRHVCPLLAETPKGLRCSVDAAEVRPFWGRALAAFGTGALALYLVATLLLFGAFRLIGYRVDYAALAWPPHWSSLSTARAEYFLEKARAAFGREEIREGVLALSIAYDLDPTRYATGLDLAQGWQLSGQGGLADRTFLRLYGEHPAQRAHTAEVWLRSLLVRSEFGRIQELATARLGEGAPDSAAWLRALLFAARYAPDREGLAAMRDNAGLRPEIREIVALELRLQEDPSPAVLADLAEFRPASLEFPFLHYFQAERLIRFGEPRLALRLLEAAPGIVGPLDEQILKIAIFQGLGRGSLAELELERRLDQPLDTQAAAFIGAQLIRRPDPILLNRFYRAYQQSSLLSEVESLAALFSACGRAGDWPKMEAVQGAIDQVLERHYLALNEFARFFRRESAATRVEFFLGVLPLPIEVIYALLETYSPPERDPAGRRS